MRWFPVAAMQGAVDVGVQGTANEINHQTGAGDVARRAIGRELPKDMGITESAQCIQGVEVKVVVRVESVYAARDQALADEENVDERQTQKALGTFAMEKGTESDRGILLVRVFDDELDIENEAENAIEDLPVKTQEEGASSSKFEKTGAVELGAGCS